MQYTTVEEVAQVYDVDEETVRRWCRKGLIDGAIHAGRRWKIPIKYKSGDIPIDFQKKEAEKETQD